MPLVSRPIPVTVIATSPGLGTAAPQVANRRSLLAEQALRAAAAVTPVLQTVATGPALLWRRTQALANTEAET